MHKGSETEIKNTRHVKSLDGIRGTAALYVLLHHAWLQTGTCGPAMLHRALGFLAYGQAAVAVFIVLSGYVLMLPVAKNDELRGGFRRFIQHRCRRILPPYYLGLVIAAAIAGLARLLRLPPEPYERFTPTIIASHLFMLHNLNMTWYQALDPPLWTVATEFQIYFVFAWVLLPIWRKFGIWRTVGVALLLGIAPLTFSKLHSPTFFWACPWYLGLFSFGMLAAYTQWSRASMRRAIPWVPLGLASGAAYFAIWIFKPTWTHHQMPLDLLIGMAAMCLIGYCASFAITGRTAPRLVRIFESSASASLAAWSYTLYLIHMPVLSLLSRLFALHLSGNALCAVVWLVVAPLTAAICYALYLPVEKRFSMQKGGYK